MPNISEDIEKMIFRQNPDYLHLESDHEQYIRQCLDDPKYTNIEKLFQFVAKVHEKNELFELLKQLWQYESAFDKILPDHRDHYRHSANVYALGLAIYNSSHFFRDALKIGWHPKEDQQKQKTSFLFRWSLASIFHDLAYPMEISIDCFNDYCSKTQFQNKNQKSFIIIDPKIWQDLNILPQLKPNLGQEDTAIGLISKSLTDFQPDRSVMNSGTLINYIERTVNSDLAHGKVDHGVFASIILLNRIHHMYKERADLPEEYFYNEVVNSCSAIFLHKFYCHSKLVQIFGNGKYLYDYPSPIGFLLYVCDTMCEWSRKSEEEKHLFSVTSDNNIILFKISAKFKEKMSEEIGLFDDRVPLRVEWNK